MGTRGPTHTGIGSTSDRTRARMVDRLHGDGSSDLGEDLTVDAIIVTAGATHVPTALFRYLRAAGRMVLPLANPDDAGTQRLTVIEAAGNGYREQTFDAVRFVPLLPGTA